MPVSGWNISPDVDSYLLIGYLSDTHMTALT